MAELVSLLSSKGLCFYIRPYLNKMIIAGEQDRTDEMLSAGDRYTANWAKRVLDGCGNPF